jgi:hypothetical protein
MTPPNLENIPSWLVDWSLVTIMGNTLPPRDPNDENDEDDEDDKDDNDNKDDKDDDEDDENDENDDDFGAIIGGIMKVTALLEDAPRV